MKIPKGEPLHKNLSSTFTNLRRLVEELKKNGFSGVVEALGVNVDGLILIDGGTVASVRIKRKDGKVDFGKKFLNSLYELSENEELIISTYKLPPESIIYLTLFLNSNLVEEGVDTNQVDIESIIEKYKGMEGDFFIEVQFNKNLGVGLIFIQEGIVMDGLLSLLGKELTTSEEAINGIIEGAKELGATVSVYKTEFDPEVTGMMTLSFSKEEKEEFFNDLFSVFFRNLENSAKKKEDIELLVRETSLELAENYPILDPFLGEFLYKNEKVEINTLEEEEELVISIFKLLESLLKKFEDRKWKFNLESFKNSARKILLDRNAIFYEKHGIESKIDKL